MIEIYLDGVQLEVPQDISIGLNLGIADFADPITASGAYTQTVEIPRTPHNDKVFKFSGEVLSAEMFNHSEHTARIVEDGCELVEGRAFLEGVSQTSYNIQVVGEEIDWVENIRDKKLSDIEGKEIGRFKPDEWMELIGNSAEYYPGLSFVLMQHGHWYQDTDDEPIRRTWATYNDLIPIVKLYTLLEHLFASHTIVVGDSLRKALHQTYASMGWKANEDASILAEDMSFEITSKLLGANEDGELTATLTSGNKAVLPLFDTIEEDKNGVLKKQISTDDPNGTILFFPKRECAMALEIKTRYQTSTAFSTTTYQDKDGGWDDVAMGNPSFADQLYTGATAAFPFVQFRVEDSLEWGARTLLADKNTDVKEINTWHGSSTFAEDLSPSKMPLLGIEIARPEEVASIGYLVDYVYTRLTGNEESVIHRFYRPTLIGASHFNVVRSNQSRYGEGIIADKHYELNIYPAYRGTDGIVYSYFENSLSNQQNYIKKSDNIKVYNLNTDNRLTFDVALKAPTRLYQAGQYPINRLYFGSSTYPDKEITVYGTEGGSLKPSFEWGVPIREGVKLSDVGGDALAEDMLRSIMQLYNLIIYTNPKTKQVHLYSFADFWNNNIVDWSDRIDLDSDISTSAMGDTIGKSVMLQYADSNPRIDYYNDRHSLPYFAYKKALSTKMIKEEKSVENTLFTPAYMVKVAEEFGSGSGKIPAVAKKGEEGNVLDFNIADIPHTLVIIPEGDEIAETASLPLDTTVFGDVGGIQPPMTDAIPGVTTLSFADSNGIEGLHKHYDKQMALWEKAKRLTCYCRVEAWEIEALRHNSDNINFRSLFKLNINGEDIYGRLESIEYEPTNTTNKCVFIIE